jgi:ligand-binding sensor protein
MTSSLDLDKLLQLFLDLLSLRTGLPICILYRKNSNPLYTQKCVGELPEFCKYLEKDSKLNQLCEKDHKKRADHLNHPFCEYCHFGIANIKHPIFVGNKHFGTILIGKRRIIGNEHEEWERFKKRLEQIEKPYEIDTLKKDEMIEKFNSVQKISLQDFKTNCYSVLDDIGLFFSEVLLIYEKAIFTESNRLLSIQLAAHEFISPLVSIKGDVELLEELVSPKGDKEIITICQSIWDATERLMVVADSLRSGMISIEGDYNFHRKHLFTVVNKCIKPYEMMAKEKGVIIKKPIIKPNDIYVEIASEEFELALKNLINNAVKYSYFGTTERSNYVEIIGNLSIKKGYYEIKISNLGIGIEPEEIKNRTITKKFVRGKLSNDSERIGTGIGLFVVEKVIKKHKGWLEFTSEFKDGPYLNTFSIGFPITHENGG